MPETGVAPLAGKRIVITRAALQNSELAEKLSAAGAIPISLPLISFAAPEDYKPLDAALMNWRSFGWVMFTSAFAVQAVVVRAARLGRNLTKSGAPPHIAVVGPATRDKATLAGFSVEYTARQHIGVSLAEELGERVRGERVLLPRSDKANPDLPAALAKNGAQITEVVAYRTLRVSEADQERLAQIARGEADAILFFSPSAVQSFLDAVGRKQLSVVQNRVAMGAIGPVTARALREAGVQRVLVAEEPTAEAVVQSLKACFLRR